jgi:superfamily I DNA and/or RNA helicase
VGFLEDWRRANVALSRARTALVVVGHKSTLRSSKTWNAFLQHAQHNACLVPLKDIEDVFSSTAIQRR